MSTSYSLKNLLENKEFILQYYKNDFKNDLGDINDFINYIFLKIMLEFKECSDLLKNDAKKELNELLEELNIINKNILVRNLIKFLKDNYNNVFYNKCNEFISYDVKIWYVKLSLNYPEVFDEIIIKKLIDDETILIFDYYSNIKKRLSKNLKKKLFLEKESLEKILKYRSTEFFKFILPGFEENLKIEVLNKLYNIYSDRSELFFEKKEQSIGWIILQDLELLYPIYYKSKNYFSKEILEKKKKVSSMLSTLLIESETIKSKDFIVSSKTYSEYLNILRNKNIDSNVQHLTITHFFEKKIISKLEFCSKNYKKSFIDFGSSNIPNNDFFSTGKILEIDNFIFQEYTNLTVWLYDADNRKYFFDNLLQIVKQNYANLLINISETEIDDDFEALNYCLTDIFNSKKNHNYNYFTSVFFVISLLEKILRNIYIKVEKDGFFNSSSATYSLILKSENMRKLIGNETIKWLKYYLIGEEEVGINYRNRIAHFTKIKIGDVSEMDLLKILYLFILTVNSIFVNSQELIED